MTNPKHTDTGRSGDLVEREAIAWANKVSKASGTSYTAASRNAAAFILQTATALEQVRRDALEEAAALIETLRPRPIAYDAVAKVIRALKDQAKIQENCRAD